ncbi:unnamed protein product [Larinioides sclopetarius]|uniref:Uncharacterized protein n=1 Tax=Larinioides sclopetarius TaxID=280406 RepID=A0AAV2A1T9_9ARAC
MNCGFRTEFERINRLGMLTMNRGSWTKLGTADSIEDVFERNVSFPHFKCFLLVVALVRKYVAGSPLQLPNKSQRILLDGGLLSTRPF